MGERIRGKRLEAFVGVLSEKIDKINICRNRVDYFQSNDFYDLTINIINSLLKTNSKLKYEILSEIYIKGINGNRKWEQDLIQTFVRHVNELTPNHILVFKYLAQHTEEFEDLDSYQSLSNYFTTQASAHIENKYEFRMYLKDIENKTLLRFNKNIKEFGNSGGFIALENYKEVRGITLTSIGAKFSEYLQK